MRTVIILCAAAMAGAAPAAAGSLTTAKAMEIIDGCKAFAKENDQRFAIAVADGGGHPLAFVRMERVNAGAGAFSREKAQAAAVWGFATSGMAQGAESTPGFAHAPYVVTVAGGVPIYDAAGERIGAVGVSGGPPAVDEQCALAGVKAAGLSPTRK